MPYSYNGWLGLSTAALQRKYLTTFSVPGTDPVRRFRVRKGDVTICFKWLATRFDREVESLTKGHPNDDWSFAYRSTRGSSSLSCHASGTACDFNATRHPLGTNPRSNFTAKQIRRIHRLISDSRKVFRWGGDYSGRKDPMHFEVNTTTKGVAKLATKIRAASSAAVEEAPVYNSASTGRHALKAGVWNTIPWDRRHAGAIKKGKPGIVWGSQTSKYRVEVEYELEGIAHGEVYYIRLVEMAPDGKGGWKVADVIAMAKSAAVTAHQDKTRLEHQFGMLGRAADSMGSTARVWLQIKPAYVDAVLTRADAKASD